MSWKTLIIILRKFGLVFEPKHYGWLNKSRSHTFMIKSFYRTRLHTWFSLFAFPLTDFLHCHQSQVTRLLMLFMLLKLLLMYAVLISNFLTDTNFYFNQRQVVFNSVWKEISWLLRQSKRQYLEGKISIMNLVLLCLLFSD